MATIYKELLVKASPAEVWDAIKDFGAVHTRLARGFVTDTVRSGDVRTVTFVNGFVARERLVGVHDGQRRLAYALVGDAADHHNAFFQVLDGPGGQTRLLWVTDVLPEEARATFEPMVDQGSLAIRRTLEAAAVESPR